MYHTLKVLMDETDEQKFKQMIETAVVQMKEKLSTKEFGDYLKLITSLDARNGQIF